MVQPRRTGTLEDGLGRRDCSGRRPSSWWPVRAYVEISIEDSVPKTLDPVVAARSNLANSFRRPTTTPAERVRLHTELKRAKAERAMREAVAASQRITAEQGARWRYWGRRGDVNTDDEVTAFPWTTVRSRTCLGWRSSTTGPGSRRSAGARSRSTPW